MKTIQSRFGEIEYDDSLTLHFSEGLIGFEELHDFVVMPKREGGVWFWIQSVEDSEVAFVLTDPTNFFMDYAVAPDTQECAKLQIGSDDECFALSVVTIHADKSVTLNLAAPILYAPKTNRALQVILEGAPYNTRTPLPKT